MITLLIDSSGLSRDVVAGVLELVRPGKLDCTISADEAEKHLTALRKELPQIRAWLLDGGAQFRARMAAACINATNDH